MHDIKYITVFIAQEIKRHFKTFPFSCSPAVITAVTAACSAHRPILLLLPVFMSKKNPGYQVKQTSIDYTPRTIIASSFGDQKMKSA
jgi:hypothetical protein